MKNQFLKITLVLALFVMGAVAIAGAQTLDSARATVPFDFVVRGVKFPAGNYKITKSVSDSRIVFIETADNPSRRAVFLFSESESDSTPTSLIFDVSRGEHVLRTIRRGGR